MKKILSLFLALTLLLSLPLPSGAEGERGELSLGTVSGKAGESVSLTLTLSGAPALKSMYVEPVYDKSALTLTNFSWVPESLIDDYDQNDGTAVITFSENTDINGSVAILDFTLSENVREGSYSVSLEYNAMEKLEGGRESVVSLRVIPGAVNVGCLSHEAELQNAAEPTCTKAGYSGDRVCKNCGTVLEKGRSLSAWGHHYGAVSYDWAADGESCTASRSCERCTYSETAEGIVSSEIKDGKTVYTALFAERWAKTAVKEVPIESDVVLRIGTVEAKAGETVTVPISIEKNPGIGDLRFSLVFDTDYLSITDCSSKLGGTPKYKNNKFSWVHNEDVSSTGEAFDFTFQIADNAVGKLNIVLDVTLAENNDWDDFSVTVIPGAIIVPCTHQKTVLINKRDAGCEEIGYTGDTVCADCGVTVKKGSVIAPLGHDWGESQCKRCTMQKPLEYQYTSTVKVSVSIKVEQQQTASPLTQKETDQLITQMVSNITANVGTALEEDGARMKVELQNFTSMLNKEETEIKTTSVKYELKPTHSNGSEYSNAELKEKLDGKKIKFRLPIPDSMALAGATVYISHYLDGSTVPVSCEPLTVQGEAGALYVEYEADSFSVYELSVLPVEIDEDNTGLSLTLDGSVGLNVYLDVDHFLSVEEQESAYIVMKYNHNTESYGTDLTPDEPVGVKGARTEDGFVKVSASVTPAQILDEIHCSLYYGDGTLCTKKVYSVKTYCDLAKTAGSEALKPLCAALLDYGSACQTYFKYNAGNLANGGSYDEALANVTADGIQGFSYGDAYKPTGVSFMALTQSQVRFYFAKAAETASSNAFTVEKGSSQAGQPYVAVTNIPASKLQEAFTLNVDGHEYTGCGLSYAKLALVKSSNEQLKTLSRALIRYNETAVEYFAGDGT